MRSRRYVLALFGLMSAGCGLVGYQASALTEDAAVDADAAPADATMMDTAVEVDAARTPLCADGSCKAVFVSHALAVQAIGSVASADARCQGLAEAAGLGGVFRAWLSDDTTSPSVRFARATVPYRLVSGTQVANDYADLTDGSLDHPIDADVTGTTLADVPEVWTGTYTDGTSSGSSCGNWTNTTASTPYATVGVTNNGGAAWTEIYMQFCDRTGPRLYCFEQ